MKLPVAHCPKCRCDVIVYRTTAPDADALTAPLQTRCIDCDTRLDRFGQEPEVALHPWEQVTSDGYTDLDMDRPRPIGRGGCFETRGCDGCPKIDSRPW
ncbi:MAG: hypothetical protein GY898_09080 [Proteobacteria bacterium]|nr:hypothetical protein [Pseudomonadota bacterium]